MIAINTQFKKNRLGGIYLCKVFNISGCNVEEITRLFENVFTYKDGVLNISFGSGTGFNRLKQYLQENKDFLEEYGLDTRQIIDFSI